MLKIGVIGAGHLGKFHLNNWAVIEGVQLIGFVDTDDVNEEQVAQKANMFLLKNHWPILWKKQRHW